MYHSGKTFPYSEGLSASFRQWRAGSHCHFIHGYALQIELEFSSTTLDDRNWVMDFGSFGPMKDWLKLTFDHTTLVAEDDPHLYLYRMMEKEGVMDLRVLPAVGCEYWAKMIYNWTKLWLLKEHRLDLRLDRVTVREHERNWAAYTGVTGDELEAETRTTLPISGLAAHNSRGS